MPVAEEEKDSVFLCLPTVVEEEINRQVDAEKKIKLKGVEYNGAGNKYDSAR